MPSIISLPLVLLGVYRLPWFFRAIRRRRHPAAGSLPLDPWITIGLRTFLWICVAALAAAALVPLWLFLGWPRWLGLAGLYAMGGLGLLQLCIVIPVLSVRITLEERRFRDNAPVT